jgi:hypothetical protein
MNHFYLGSHPVGGAGVGVRHPGPGLDGGSPPSPPSSATYNRGDTRAGSPPVNEHDAARADGLEVIVCGAIAPGRAPTS